MKKILFLHGFYASGNCTMAHALRNALSPDAVVLGPDLPLRPMAALEFILQLCQKEQPDILVGNSCGSFYGQIVSRLTHIPALLGNPHFEMHEFLASRMGEQQYKSPRTDGQQHFVVNEQLAQEFLQMEESQFAGITKEQQQRVWGLFGSNDTLAHYRPLFETYYPTVYTFPGNHTPTEEEVKNWYAPLAIQLWQHTLDQ